MSAENHAVAQRIKGFFSSAAYFWNGVTDADKYQK